MKHGVLISILFLFVAVSLKAQQRIDIAKVYSVTKPTSFPQAIQANMDTLINVPDSLARFFTTRFGSGEKIGFQQRITLEEGTESFNLNEVRIPFFGGTATSNGLSSISARLFMWLGDIELEGLISNQPEVQSSTVEVSASINEMRYFIFSLPETLVDSDTTLRFMLYVTASDTFSRGVSPVFSEGIPFQNHIYMDSVAVDTVTSALVQSHSEYWSTGPGQVGDIIYQIIGQYVYPDPDPDGTLTSTIPELPEAKPSQITITNYPNPFNPSTVIRATIPVAANYTISIFDMFGRLIRMEQRFLSSGVWENTVDFSTQSSGTYFVQIKGENMVSVHPMVLVK